MRAGDGASSLPNPTPRPAPGAVPPRTRIARGSSVSPTAPGAGIFHPAPVGEVTAEGELVAEGGVVGYVSGPGRPEPIVSFCAGFLVRFVAHPGERVRQHQPVAWLHPFDRPATRPVVGS